MITSRIIQLCLTIHVILLLVNSSYSLPAPPLTAAISPSTNSESSTSTTQSTTTENVRSSGCTVLPTNDNDSCSCTQLNPGSCTSLPDAIFTVFRRERHVDTPYHFFTLKDLFYSFLLDSRDHGPLQGLPLDGSIDPGTTSEQELTQRRCNDLITRYDLPTKDTNGCSWTYTCTQNQLHFPSFHVEAVLDSGSTGECASVRTVNDLRFKRTSCQQDPCRADWLECNCGTKVVGFRAS